MLAGVGLIAAAALLLFLVRSFIGDLSNTQILAEMGDAYQLSSNERIRLFSSLPDAEARAFLQRISDFQDAFFASYGEAFQLSRPDRIQRVIEFRSRQEFLAYTRRHKNVSLDHSAGIHDPASAQIVYYATTPGQREETIFHELVHYNFGAGIGIDRPAWNAWFSEGIASFLERGIIVEGKLLVADHSELAFSQAFDRNPPDWTRIEMLYAAERTDVLGEDNRRFYAGAELLVSFLMQHHPEGLFAYGVIEAAPRQATPSELAKACGFESSEQLQADYDAFLQTLTGG